jgi:hypothetical protein
MAESATVSSGANVNAATTVGSPRQGNGSTVVANPRCAAAIRTFSIAAPRAT